ncbi:MAG: hypothetical protein P1V35_14975 [Planctomycetota bacterium]|nr:hypothetical protein [Planctomycetota bacterium]
MRRIQFSFRQGLSLMGGVGLALLLALPGYSQWMGQEPVAQPAKLQEPATQGAKQVSPLSKVAFIGASVSAGFGNASELKVGRNVPLGTYFEAMLPAEAGAHTIHNFGSAQFFTSPLKLGKRQVENALAEEPSMVVGVDFLFWYAFGYPRPGNSRRMEGLRLGLAQLEDLTCPLIVGDLPNVDHALNGQSPLRAGHPILQRGQLPDETERLQMNRLIHAWAAERENVRVFPLAELMRRMISGEEMKLQGNAWKVENLDQILQKDLLHPRSRGMVWVALYVADFTLQWPGVERTRFDWKENSIQLKLKDFLKPARAKQAALELRRKERRAKRDKRLEAEKAQKERESSGL